MTDRDFTKGPIVPKLIRFVIPILFASLIQQLYGAVDLLVVGQFSDAANISAVSVGSQLMHTVTLMITELSVGTTILLGQTIGQHREKECGQIVGATVFTFALLGLAVAVVMQPLAPPVLRLLNAPREAFAQAAAYTNI